MQRNVLQAELVLPRKRVELKDGPERPGYFARRDGETLAETVDRRMRGLAGPPIIDQEAFIGVTDWQTGKPPCTGYWEINNGISEQVLRRWYDAEKDEWRTSKRVDDICKFPFTADLRWRGLKAPASGYTWRVPGQRVVLEV